MREQLGRPVERRHAEEDEPTQYATTNYHADISGTAPLSEMMSPDWYARLLLLAAGGMNPLIAGYQQPAQLLQQPCYQQQQQLAPLMNMTDVLQSNLMPYGGAKSAISSIIDNYDWSQCQQPLM